MDAGQTSKPESCHHLAPVTVMVVSRAFSRKEKGKSASTAPAVFSRDKRSVVSYDVLKIGQIVAP